ncbi:MAG: hypothetical protein ABWY22_13000 [Flavobacterium sp.]
MGKLKGIRIESEFEKEVKRRTKENYDLLVAKTTYEKNKWDLKIMKWLLFFTVISTMIQLIK